MPTYTTGGTALRFDPIDGGALRIVGDTGIKPSDGGVGATVTGLDGEQMVPMRRKVRLFHRLTARLVREVWSATANGRYEFRSLKDQEYLIVTDDYTRTYNAVAADAVRPEP